VPAVGISIAPAHRRAIFGGNHAPESPDPSHMAGARRAVMTAVLPFLK
jgi:hypothetical protein